MAGCDPKQSGAVIPTQGAASATKQAIKTAPYELVAAGTTAEMKIAQYVAAKATAKAPELYLTGSAALGKQYTALGVQTLAAFSLTGETTTIDSQREVDAILALGNGLSSKLDKCVSVNIDTTV